MPRRQQATVMFTDIVGFTSIMEESENKAMSFIENNMYIVNKSLNTNKGQLIKELGDGSLCIFDSPVNAITSALEIQDALHESEYKVRIGIHSGSVLFEGNDVFGDTVNVASRLESKAPTGGILVSEEVLTGCNTDFYPKTTSLGLTRLKGLGRLLNIHFIGSKSCVAPKLSGTTKIEPAKSMNISVFPFKNNGKPEDSYFAYGLYSDLLDNLKKTNSLTIVPVTSLMKAQRNKNTTQEDVAKLFNSSILITGTVTLTDGYIQISVVLKNINSNRIIWSDSWNEDINDLPVLKGKLTDSILKALGKNPFDFPDLTRIEVQSASIYEKYLKALHLWDNKKNRNDLLTVRSILKEVISNEPQMIPAMALLAATYRLSGDYKTCIDILDSALKVTMQHNNKIGQLTVFRARGVCFWSQGNLDKALVDYTKAMEIAILQGNPTEECSLLNNIGLIDCNKLNFSSAFEKLNKSLDIALSLESKTGQAHALCNIGLTYWKQGNASKALEYYHQSRQLIKEIQDISGESNLLINMGIIYNSNGDPESALELAKSALKLGEKLSDLRGICFALTNIGNYLLILGLNEEANQSFTRAIDIARKIGLKTSEELLLTNIGVYYLCENKIEEATNIFEESLDMAKELDDTEGIIENQKYLADILISQNELSKATELLNSSINLCNEYHLEQELPWLHSSLAHCMARGTVSLKTVLDTLTIAESHISINKNDVSQVYNNISKTYQALIDCRELSDLEAELFLQKTKKWEDKCRESILSFSKNIKSEHNRNTFFTNIPLHREMFNKKG